MRLEGNFKTRGVMERRKMPKSERRTRRRKRPRPGVSPRGEGRFLTLAWDESFCVSRWRRVSESNRNWCFQSHRLVQSQLSQSQAHRMTGSEIARKIWLLRTPRQARQNSVTTHEEILANSFTGELLAFVIPQIVLNPRQMALFSSTKSSERCVWISR